MISPIRMSCLAPWLIFTARCGNISSITKTMAPSSASPPCTYFGQDLGEIRSVAVLPEFQKTGIGSHLVKKCLRKPKALGLKKVFALTTRPDFFKRLGFQEVPKEELPPIIWSECKDCVKFPDNCNEIPMLLELESLDITITDSTWRSLAPWRDTFFTPRRPKAQKVNLL